MNILEVLIQCVRPTGIPDELIKRCKPGDGVFRLTVSGDVSVVTELEEMASQLTIQYPTIPNDIGLPGICDESHAAKAAHAFEHGAVLSLVDSGRIDLMSQNFRVRLP